MKEPITVLASEIEMRTSIVGDQEGKILVMADEFLAQLATKEPFTVGRGVTEVVYVDADSGGSFPKTKTANLRRLTGADSRGMWTLVCTFVEQMKTWIVQDGSFRRVSEAEFPSWVAK